MYIIVHFVILLTVTHSHHNYLNQSERQLSPCIKKLSSVPSAFHCLQLIPKEYHRISKKRENCKS